MQWTDEGIVLGVKRHGESSGILELLTRAHGRHLGLVRGGLRLAPQADPAAGQSVSATWRARLDEHLGTYTVEAAEPARRRLFRRVACGLWRHPSRRADAAVARARSAREPCARAGDHARPARRCRPGRRPWWCASNCRCWPSSASASISPNARRPATRAELVYVSPKSGRAVSRDAGAPLCRPAAAPAGVPARRRGAAAGRDLADGFALTGYFLTRHALEPRGLMLADERAHFIAALNRALAKVA